MTNVMSFYRTRTLSATCEGSASGSVCTGFGLNVVDLAESSIRSVNSIKGDICSRPTIHPFRQDGALVSCTSGRIFTVSAATGDTEELIVGGQLPPHSRVDRLPTAPTPIVGAFERSDGSVAILFESGWFRIIHLSQSQTDVRALPIGSYVVGIGHVEARGGLLVIPYQSLPQEGPSGAVIFDLDGLVVIERFEAEAPITGSTVAGRARMLLGETIVEFDPTTQRKDAIIDGFPRNAGLVVIQ